jgi:hypothetical protein
MSWKIPWCRIFNAARRNLIFARINLMSVALKKKIFIAVAAVLLSTGWVPMPSQNTTTVYEAQGANALKGSGGGCTGVAWSYYRFNLNGPDRPVPAWRTEPEEVRVSVLPKDGVLNITYSGWSARNRKSIAFDASKIQIRVDGKIGQPKDVSVNQYTGYLWGTSLNLEIDIGTNLPATVILDTGPKAIVVDGHAFPLPTMIFNRATRTTTMLTRPINC